MSSPVFYSLCIITVIASTFLVQAVGALRLKKCPSYVMEKSNVSCTCLTKMKKPHNVTWPGHSQSGSLFLTNVQRSDNGTQYTCLLTADGSKEEVVYTLRVAYGPYDGQVSISPSHLVRNGTQPVTLTCTAEDTYPTPSYEWSGVSCENQVSDDACTFSLYPKDNGREVTCTAESVTLSRKPSYTFHNSVRGTASGTINLNVTLLRPDCGEDLVANSSEQFITSPGHSNQYCVWHITASPGQQIWVDSLEMELETRDPCNRASVSFYDGDEKNGKLLGKFCKRLGNYVPIMPASGMATIVFVSTWGGSGFRLIYKTLPGCVESLTADSSIQTIEPPGYPEKYLTNMVCVWQITAPAGKSIRLNFTDFQIEKSRSCKWDYVHIYDGERGGQLLGEYCGNKDHQSKAKFKPVTSFMNKTTVVFKSDVLYPARGFSLQYTATDTV
ncbi:neuropilin-1a-like [Littorina saxatilis]|uniref:Uncharacterized protein n=1 Tax=Littorina saxatilis TaxID=31220 RepID=A0AAN9BIR5_9CAEN